MTLSKTEGERIRRLAKIAATLPEQKQDVFLAFGEGMAAMVNRYTIEESKKGGDTT